MLARGCARAVAAARAPARRCGGGCGSGGVCGCAAAIGSGGGIRQMRRRAPLRAPRVGGGIAGARAREASASAMARGGDAQGFAAARTWEERAAATGAFVEHAPLDRSGEAYGDGDAAGGDAGTGGALAGLSFAAKDLFDVAGTRTGFGNPTWLERSAEAAADAPAVAALRRAGAVLVGKTEMDELAYSLNGENAHYGTPLNPAAPDRIPGGSSSGSASAVAAGLVDFSLGSDTGGSVRVPASFCGIYGLRPTHGRGDLAAAAPLAPSFDTPGIFARDAKTLRAASLAMLGSEPTAAARSPTRWLVAADAFELAEQSCAQAVYGKLSGDAFQRVCEALGSEPAEVSVAEGAGAGDLLDGWRDTFRLLQASEIWGMHADFVEGCKPDFGPGIKERFEMAKGVHGNQPPVEEAAKRREAITEHMDAMLAGGAILAMPTAPGAAPTKALPTAELEVYRARMLALTAIAGLARLPQVSVPIAVTEDGPVGLSLVAARGEDEMLLAATEMLAAVVGMQ